VFLHTLRVFFPHTFIMMHLCITQCTYWTPVHVLQNNQTRHPTFIHSHRYTGNGSTWFRV